MEVVEAEESSRVGKGGIESEKGVGKRMRPSDSPVTSEVDVGKQLEVLRRELREAMEAMEKQRGIVERINREIEFFEGDNVGFQVVGKKGKVSEGSSRGKKGSSGGGSTRIIKYFNPDSDGHSIPTYEEVKKIRAEEKGVKSSGKKEQVVGKKEKRNPPITISREDSNIAEEVLRENGVDFKIQLGKQDSKLWTSGAKVYKETTDILEKSNISASWGLRKEERPIRAVMKGLPKESGLDGVRKDLEAEGVKVISIARMGSKKVPLDMVAVNTVRSEEGRRIFNLSSVGNYKVKVEARRKPVHQSQCFRCLGFGHVQYRCTRKEACAFCAEEHQSRDCTRPRGIGAEVTCFHCGGPHPAFFKSCPRNPEMVEAKREEVRRKKVLEAEVKPGVSYADRLKRAEKKGERVVQVSKGIEVSLEDRIEALIRKMVPDIVKALNG